MALATASATMESSQSLIQSETRVQRSYQEVQVSEQRTIKKKTKSRRHKDEGNISVSKSSEKLFKKMKAATDTDAIPQCEKCSRPVYAMERIKAEKRIWHKECFRCVQCNKQLTVETYQSDHTTLYCKPHFKQLFEPKPVDDDDVTDAAPPKKHQMIICESNPVELPPDVVRASDKPDLGLEELSQLDVKSKFEVFERKARQPEEPVPQEPRVPREKTAAILSKLAKFKAKGMDVGVSDEYLNGVPVEQRETGNCYKLHTKPLNWIDAYATCLLERTTLAVIDSTSERDFLANLAIRTATHLISETYQKGIFHLGFHNRHNTGWTTVRGNPIVTDNEYWWGGHYPGEECNNKCGGMFYNGYLVNNDCEVKSFFICEHQGENHVGKINMDQQSDALVPEVVTPQA